MTNASPVALKIWSVYRGNVHTEFATTANNISKKNVNKRTKSF